MSPVTCQDVQKRLDVFLDGELDGRTMRGLALHVTRCESCETELRRFERIQELLSTIIEEEVDRVDVAGLWGSIEGRLVPPRRNWLEALVAAWTERPRAGLGMPAVASGLAVVALVTAIAVWPSPEEAATEPIVRSNAAHIERLESTASNVVVWSEPGRETTAILVSYSP